MLVKPNFFIIGAPKAGTTSMWDLLRRHPDIFMPRLKEPAFFSLAEVYARGWNWYESLFVEGAEKTAIGEATPNYSRVESYSETPGRIGASHLHRKRSSGTYGVGLSTVPQYLGSNASVI